MVSIELKRFLESGIALVECPDCARTRTLSPRNGVLRFPSHDKRKIRTPNTDWRWAVKETTWELVGGKRKPRPNFTERTLFTTGKGDRSARDDISDIAASSDRSVEDEDVRLVLHQPAYDLMWRYLTRYLPSADSILEIGAGTGRYTLALCKRGNCVTAVDLSVALLERCKLRLEASRLHGQVPCVVADARGLHAVPATAFDAVLL